MFDLLQSIGGVVRWIFLFLDSIGLTFIDNGYNLMVGAMTAFDQEAISQIAGRLTNNCYIIVGIFALFRLALLLINSIITPEKLTEEKNGLGNVVVNLIITIVLFIAVPFVFDKAWDLHRIIVNNNYIPKLIIGKELTSSGDNANAGTYIKDIAVRSLIYPDEKISKIVDGQYVGDEDKQCDSECMDAIEAWTNDVSLDTLNDYIASFVKTDKYGRVFVYKYTPIVTLIVGGFITYVLFSFAIDIIIKTLELVALQILAPLFIITFVDPKSADSGTFKRWLTACGKTYVSLFIKIVIICLMLLFVSQINTLISSTSGTSGMLKLLILIGILIFAKKAPKWIGDMIGVEGGLGELGIGKKLGGMALVGGLASKAWSRTGHGILGAGSAMINNAIRNRRALKDAKKKANLTYGRRLKDSWSAMQTYKDKNGTTKGFWKQRHEDIQAKREAEGLRIRDKAKMYGAGTIGGVATGFAAGIKADKITGSLKAGIEASNQFSDKQGLEGKPITQTIKDKVKSPYESMLKNAYGDETARSEARKRIMDANTREENTTEKGLAIMGGRDNERFVASMGDFIKATNGGTARNFDDAIAMVRAYANGEKAYYNHSGQLEIETKGGNVISGKALDSYTKEAKGSFTALGTARMEEMYNKSMQTIASEYESNDQYITRANQNIMSISQNMKSLIATKPGVVSDPTTGALYAEYTSKDAHDNDVVHRIPIDLSDVDGTVAKLQSVHDTTKDSGIQGKIKSYIEALTGNNMTNYRTAMVQSQRELQIALQRKEQTQPVYDNIGKEVEIDDDGNPKRDSSGKIIYKDTGIITHQQKVDYLNNKARKAEKAIKEFEIKKDDKK